MVYPALGSVYPFLPPFLGYAYVRWREAFAKREWFDVFVWFYYALVIETVWGFPLYGSWAIMFALYRFVDFETKVWAKTSAAIRFLNAASFDLAYFGFLYGAGIVMQTRYFLPGSMFWYDTAADLLWAVLF